MMIEAEFLLSASLGVLVPASHVKVELFSLTFTSTYRTVACRTQVAQVAREVGAKWLTVSVRPCRV